MCIGECANIIACFEDLRKDRYQPSHPAAATLSPPCAGYCGEMGEPDYLIAHASAVYDSLGRIEQPTRGRKSFDFTQYRCNLWLEIGSLVAKQTLELPNVYFVQGRFW